MSLMLRKACQDVLNDNNLPNYHVRIDASKCLSIVGPCGKPLLTISGIVFSRTTPTAAEIEYAVELFYSFMEKHEIALNHYIELVTEVGELLSKNELILDDSVEVSLNTGWHYAPGTSVRIETMEPRIIVKASPLAVTLNLDLQITDISVCSKSEPFDAASINLKAIPKKKEIKVALSVLQQRSNIWKLEQEMQKAVNQLSSCDI